MKIDGHCHCGRITFEAEVDPDAITIATAPTARPSLARPFAPTSRPAAHFVLRSGAPKSYVKTADSGNRRRHASAAIAAPPIYACAWMIAELFAAHGHDHPARAFSPKRQIWRRSALDWVDKLAAVPGTQTG